jgi:hypothetical protein
MASGPTDFDLGAAWLRRANGDMKAFTEGLAARLEGALPGQVAVERKKDGLFSRESHTVRISVTLENSIYTLAVERGRLATSRSRSVRGIVIKSENLPVPDWLVALNQDIRSLGEQAGAAHSVLHDFLMS